MIGADEGARRFFYAAVVNIFIAALVTSLVLDPQLGIPIKINHWPGTWIFVAYFAFLVAGVVGMIGWTVVYYMLPRLFSKPRISRRLLNVHLLGSEIGIVGATGLMGVFPGYVGGTLVQQGFGDVEVTRVVEWTVIPIGVFISLAIFATLVGLANITLWRGSTGIGDALSRSPEALPRSPAITLALAVVPGLGHLYIGRIRRGAFLLIVGASLGAGFLWLFAAVAPFFTGWVAPGFIAPGGGMVDGMGFTGLITLFLFTGILLPCLWIWQAYDSYVAAVHSR